MTYFGFHTDVMRTICDMSNIESWQKEGLSNSASTMFALVPKLFGTNFFFKSRDGNIYFLSDIPNNFFEHIDTIYLLGGNSSKLSAKNALIMTTEQAYIQTNGRADRNSH